MRKAAAILVCGLFSAGSAMADGENKVWFPIAGGESVIEAFLYSVKAQSFTREAKSSVVIVQEKTTNKELKQSSIKYFKISVTDKDCNNGYGKVRYFGLDGQHVFDVDYLKDGGSVASTVGEFICLVRDGKVKDGSIKL